MASSVASSDKEIEQQLVEAGNRLTDPPSSVDELLPLLDQVEHCLSKVEQSPPKSMQNALCPSLKALVSDQFFKHSNVDVKVAVASCISEITRITAPDAPYDDEQMKEVFQLIVSSFENLADKSSRSYVKRTSILETVAKVRSCVVMLDLECDALINEMFQHFLKAIRDYHSENVFSSMETIMSLVLEESEDISVELLSPILDSVKKDNEEVMPLAQKLAERVLESCAAKLKPYMIQAVKSLGISLDDYSVVVASICQQTSGAVEQNDITTNEHVADESNSVRASVDEEAEVDKEIATEVATPERVDPPIDRSPKSAVCNGVTLTGEDDSLADSNSIKKQEHDHLTEHLKNVDTSSNAELGSLDAEKVVNAESKQEQTAKKKGRKSNSLKLTGPSDTALIDGGKEAETLPENKDSSKDVPIPPCDDPSVEAAMSSENEKESGVQLSSPKAIEGEPMNIASPSPSGSLPDENRSKKAGRLKKKESSMKDAAPSAGDVSKKASEGTSDSEAKPSRRSGKKVASGTSNEDETLSVADASKKAPEGTSDSEAKPNRRLGKKVASGTTTEDETTVADASKKESAIASDSEAKPLKQSAKRVDASSNNAEESSKQTEGKKRRSRGKTIFEEDSSKTSTKDEDKEMALSPKSAQKPSKDECLLEETPKSNSKRKRIPGKEQTSSKDYGEEIVGSKVKVWWPKDHMYYKGIIGSFDSVKKKHMVFYNDGDEENLNLKRERWEFIESDSESDEEEADRTSPNDSSDTPQKKKAKTNSDQSTKQGKMDALPKRGGESSSKSKAAATKSGGKSKDDNKVESKSKDGSKAVSKSEVDSVGKSKHHAAKSSGKSVDVASKPAGKSKNVDSGTPKSGKSKGDGSGSLKTFTKSKQDTSKTSKSKQETTKFSSNTKGKSSKSGSKSTLNGSGKLKSGSSQAKESEDVKEDSSDLAKSQENTKGKSPSSSKAQGSEAKSGKKRRR